jgi:hypothetical protein
MITNDTAAHPTVLVEFYLDTSPPPGPWRKPNPILEILVKAKSNIAGVVAGFYCVDKSSVRTIYVNSILEDKNSFFLKVSYTSETELNVYADQLRDSLRKILPVECNDWRFETLLIGVKSTRTHAVF